MAKIKDITKRIIAFRDARKWKQFHNPKRDFADYSIYSLAQRGKKSLEKA